MARFNPNTINLKAGLDASGVATGVQKIEGHFQQLNTKIGGLSKQFSMLGNAIAGAFAVGAVGSAIQTTVNAASDLNETVSKTEQIFGSSANEIKKFAETAAESMGLSQRAAMDGAATFATFGKAAGLTGSELTKFSTDLLKLSSDLASFYNTSPEEAIVAIGAALRGESEPIRRYGVLLDDATLRQVALKNGITDTIKTALTPQQKALAANLAIFQQTTDAQGDFARTSDGLANSTRIFNAELENMKAILGQDLLPLLTKFLSKLTPAIRDLSKYGRAAFGTMSSGDIRKVEEQAKAHAAIQNTVFLQKELNEEQKKYNELVSSQGFVITDAEYRERIAFKARMNAFREEYERRVEIYNQTISQINAQEKLNTVSGSGGSGGAIKPYYEQIKIATKDTRDFTYELQKIPEILPEVEKGLQGIATSPYLQEFGQMIAELNQQIQDLVVSVAVDFLGTIGEALAGADSSFESFAGRALETLGNFFKRMGGMFMAFGFTQLKFFEALMNPTPLGASQLIAAGAALAVLGGAITQASRSFAQTGSAGSYSSVPVSTDMGGYSFTGRVDGYDLVLVTDRNQRLMNRRG